MNLPNKLSLLRIGLVFVYAAIAVWMPQGTLAGGIVPVKNIILLVIFALASLTDFLDGYLARKHNLITSFGKFIDPLADKALVNCALILMVWNHEASVIAVLLMVVRDLVVDGLRFMAASKGEVVSAGWSGKVKTVLQMVAIMALLLDNWPFVYLGVPVASLLLWLATAASLYSGWVYFRKLRHYVLESM